MKDSTTRSGDSRRLSLATRIGFGVGDIYGGGAVTIVGILYLYFLTDVVRIRPALAGTVILISKIWDAVSDPLMGNLSDRTRTRWGRRRPYFLIGVPLVFASTVLLWFPVAFASETGRFAFVLAAYVVFSTVITMVMIPYNALASELTTDYNERTRLSTARIVFSTIGSGLCAVFPLVIVNSFQSPRTGFLAMGASFGALFALPFIAVFLMTSERRDFQEHSARPSLYATFVEPFRIKPFVHILMMYLFAFVASDALQAVVIYYMTYYLGRAGDTTTLLGTLLVMQLVSLAFFGWLSGRTSKRAAFGLGAAMWIVAMAFSLLIRPGQWAGIVYLFGGFVGFANGGIVVMIYAIFPDMPDIDELYSGVRREGVYSGLFTFMRKLSSAFALFTIANLLELTGYRAPIEGADGLLVDQPQAAAFVLSLRLIFFGVPVVLMLLSLLGARLYRLTPQLHERLRVFLDRRRVGDRDESAGRGEEEALRAALALPSHPRPPRGRA